MMPMMQTTLTQNIQQSARFLAVSDCRALRTGKTDKHTADAIYRESVTCFETVASALRQGMDEEDSLIIPMYGRSGPQTMTLEQLQAWCLVMKMLANEQVYRLRIQQALLQASVWISELQENAAQGWHEAAREQARRHELSAEQAMFAAETGARLLCVLQDAQAAGVSCRMRVEMNGRMVTLSEVRRWARYVAAAGMAADAVTTTPNSIYAEQKSR